MNERPTITIKLKPWLQEFLRCKLKDDTASRKNIVGALLTPYIEYTPKDYKFQNMGGPDYMTFELPALIGDKNTRGGNIYVSEANQKNFERILDLMFKDHFFYYMDDKVRYTESITGKSGAIKRCIEQFCMDMHITYNHINYEMLKKAYYRRRESEQENEKKANKRGIKLSLSCPLIFLL
jgi:hypothetical protein